MAGDEVTSHPDGSWIRDLVKFRCDGTEFRFRQRRDVALQKLEPLKGTFCETTTVEVDGVAPDHLQRVLRALDTVCWLLSFAGLSRVMCYGYDFPTGSKTGLRKTVVGTADFFRPPINIQDGAAVKEFVERTYLVFRKVNRQRKLTVVIDYLVQAERPSLPTEIRLLLLFVTLENLKDTYARATGIPYVKGFYRKPSVKPGKPGPVFSFEELLSQMLRAVGMHRGVKQIVSLRNEIIHSGLSRKPRERQRRMYERAHDLIREYFIRLLDYHGNFFTYASRGMAIKKI
jgi:hypothetical protein